MEIKWYWLAEKLGLVKDVSALYDDGTTYVVSAKADEVFFTLEVSLVVLMFLLGFGIRFLSLRFKKDIIGKVVIYGFTGILLVYAFFLAIGIGPYIIFYPQGGGFIDLDVIGHVISGVYFVLLSIILVLGSRLGRKLENMKNIFRNGAKEEK